MKKGILIILIGIMCLSFANAEIDYSTLSDSELTEHLNAIRQEMDRRLVLASGNYYLFQNEDIEIYFTGHGKTGSYLGDGYFDLEIVFVNKSKKAIGLTFTEISINGWATSLPSAFSYVDSTLGGSKKKDYIRLFYTEADLKSWRDMDDIQVKFETMSEDYRYTYYEPITFLFGEWE